MAHQSPSTPHRHPTASSGRRSSKPMHIRRARRTPSNARSSMPLAGPALVEVSRIRYDGRMRYRNVAVGALCIAGGLLCQTPDVVPQRSRLRADLDFLTSEALAGRVSLSPQAEISARYIAADFQRSGLAPAVGSYLQDFPLIAYRSDPARRAMTLLRAGQKKAFRPGVDFTVAFSRDVDLE